MREAIALKHLGAGTCAALALLAGCNTSNPTFAPDLATGTIAATDGSSTWDMTLWPPYGCRAGRWVVKDGVSHDNDTGLDWQQVDGWVGSPKVAGVPQGFRWKEAIDYCKTLALDGGGWSAPLWSQLSTLYAQPTPYGCWFPDCAFSKPSAACGGFWTSELSPQNPTHFAWAGLFAGPNDRPSEFRVDVSIGNVRCVRHR